MPQHREQKVIAAVACPECPAKVGELCWQRSAGGGWRPPPRYFNRPIVHTPRRLAWQEHKRLVSPTE